MTHNDTACLYWIKVAQDYIKGHYEYIYTHIYMQSCAIYHKVLNQDLGYLYWPYQPHINSIYSEKLLQHLFHRCMPLFSTLYSLNSVWASTSLMIEQRKDTLTNCMALIPSSITRQQSENKATKTIALFMELKSHITVHNAILHAVASMALLKDVKK